MKVYHTLNSKYVIDTEGMRYMRHPDSIEQTVVSHRLTYGEWHPLRQLPTELPDGTLHILREDSEGGIYTSEIVRQYDI